MILSQERWVIYMRAFVRFAPANSDVTLRMGVLAGILEKVAGTSKGLVMPDPKQPAAIVSIDQVELYPADKAKYVCVLLTYSDDRGADPGFQHRATGARRVEKKKAQEANAASAHLVVSLTPVIKNGQRFYPAVLEDMTGVGKTKVAPVITQALRRSRTFPYKDQNGATSTALPSFILEAQADDQVREDAEGGHVSYFIATRDHKVEEGFDEDGFTKVKADLLKLRVAGTPTTGNGLVKMLRAVVRRAREKGYDRVQVQYKRDDGKGRSVTFGTHREDSEDFLIKRIEKIELNRALAQTSDKISEELFRKMRKLLATARAQAK